MRVILNKISDTQRTSMVTDGNGNTIIVKEWRKAGESEWRRGKSVNITDTPDVGVLLKCSSDLDKLRDTAAKMGYEYDEETY